jgi:methyl-accepting chemotaxis protein
VPEAAVQFEGDQAYVFVIAKKGDGQAARKQAVEVGATQVAAVARTFGEIAAMVSTTADAIREIELSTKQQTSAVEQVHVAIAGLAQTTRESEAGATQTLQTSSQLTSLSTSLTRLVQAGN